MGDAASVAAFREIIADRSVMGRNLYDYGSAGERLEKMTGKMLAAPGAVREAVRQSR